jgi:predicted transcriptional regulators
MDEMIGLKAIRKKKGYTQQKVAMDLNISREALSYYENGKRSPDIPMLRILSKYYDVSIDYLINGVEFKKKFNS